MKYKALILDVDRTLTVKDDFVISSKVIESILKAKEKIHVTVATSRNSNEIQPIFQQLQLTDPCITNGGSKIINPQTKEVFYEKLLTQEVIKSIDILAQKLHLELFVDDNDVVVKKRTVSAFTKPLGAFVGPIKETDALSFYEELSRIPFIDVKKITAYEGMWVIANHSEGTKQHGILELAKLLHINTHEMIGVGDSYNDFPLLMACGLKVAMGNAVSELKEIADYVAPSVEDDGVADVIEKFILKS